MRFGSSSGCALLAEAELDEEGNPVFDGSGKQIFKELSEENRRIAAEELLADLAENEADIAAFAKSDRSDRNGALFTLNSNASEELKLQVKAMQACVGAFLDHNADCKITLLMLHYIPLCTIM